MTRFHLEGVSYELLSRKQSISLDGKLILPYLIWLLQNLQLITQC